MQRAQDVLHPHWLDRYRIAEYQAQEAILLPHFEGRTLRDEGLLLHAEIYPSCGSVRIGAWCVV
jgi:hypothetical protein